MTRFVKLIVFLFIAIASFGQDISRHDADSLMKALTVSRNDNDRIDVLFTLAQFHMFKPGEYAVDLDSAKDCIEKAGILNAKVKSADANGFLVLLRSFLSREKGQMKEGKGMADSAVALLKNGKNKYYLGKAYFALSDYYDYLKPKENAEKRRLVELAAAAYQQSGNLQLQAFSLTFLADLYYADDERTKALEALDTALALYKSIRYDRLQSVYILYSTIYYLDNLFKLSLNYGLLAMKTAVSTGDSSMTLCQINNHIGLIYSELKEHEKAIAYFLNSYKIAVKHNDNNSVLLLMSNIVDTYMLLDKPAEALVFMKSIPEKLLESSDETAYIHVPYCYMQIYYELNRFADMQVYAGKIDQLMKTHETQQRDLHNFYSLMIKYYITAKQYKAAGIYMHRFDSLTGNATEYTRNKLRYQFKFSLDTALGNYRSAVANLLAYQKLNDSVFNETSNRQIKQLEVEYETDKNKNEITVLNQKNQLQQNNLDRQKLVKNFTFGGIALLVIIMGLLYRQYLHKQKSNTVILHKNEQLQHLLTEKEWLVKEIHHRVKNNFHIVSSLLEIQSSYLKNNDALLAIKESQNRIHSMSIIHQKLYQSETLSTIHMPEYIYELVEHLRESYAIRNIAFSLQIENIELNHASAITLGLMLNEAITNAIKYAFTEEEDGKICISLAPMSDSQLLLSVADNGRGLPDNFETKIGASMGMELLQGLTDDLGGSFSIETDHGTHIKVIFDYKAVPAAANVSFV